MKSFADSTPPKTELKKTEVNNEQSGQYTVTSKPHKKRQILKILLTSVVVIIVIVVLAGILKRNKPTKPTPTPAISTSPVSIATVPDTSASAITAPPSSMAGINTHPEAFGTGADPNIITLGPKIGAHPDWIPYTYKRGMEFELEQRIPVLAPIDMVLVGFQNNSAKYKIENGQTYAPVNDVALYFESVSPDWPGMIILVYHLYTSPLLPGHYQNPDCGDAEVMSKSTSQSEGHLFFDVNDLITPKKNNAEACEALIGYTVKRGELIGFAGSVGNHSMAAFCFKVSHTSENPTVKAGNQHLHWVQPSVFFYWKSYSPDTDFPSGVLAYPFETDGYQLPAEQRDVNFKYVTEE